MLYSFDLSLRYLDIHSFTDNLHLHLQPPNEYTEALLGLVASLEGMVLRRETQLSIVGVSVLFSFLAFIILQMQMQKNYIEWVYAYTVHECGVCQMCSTHTVNQCSEMFKFSMSSEV